jgi:hypothetical protein
MRTKKTRRGSIYKNRKSHCRNTKMYPIPPFFPQTTSLQQIKQEVPVHMIICLLQIKFSQESWVPRSNMTIHIFISNKNRIQDLSTSNKCILCVGDNLAQIIPIPVIIRAINPPKSPNYIISGVAQRTSNGVPTYAVLHFFHHPSIPY